VLRTMRWWAQLSQRPATEGTPDSIAYFTLYS
jgi:hypothetical protein